MNKEEFRVDRNFDEMRLLTVEEAAETLRVGRSTVWKLIREEGLPTIKVGKRRLIPVKALNEWVEKRTERGDDDSANPVDVPTTEE